MKKLLIVALFVSSVFLLTGCGKEKEPESPPSPSPTPTPAETQLSPEDRPVINLKPDTKVHNVLLTIGNLPETVKTVDYELVYTSKGLQRGVIGTYFVSKGKANLLLGSCSSGVCKYDKEISDGQLTIKYRVDGQRILLREPLVLDKR